MNINNEKILMEMANSIRALSIDAIENANSGHPGMPMGMADIATILFTYFLKFDPDKPKWLDRDRLIISNGHGSMLLYAALYLTGYKDISINVSKNGFYVKYNDKNYNIINSQSNLDDIIKIINEKEKSIIKEFSGNIFII